MTNIFGKMPNGDDVQQVTISGGPLTVSIITFAAAIQDMRLEGHAFPLVLGFEDLAGYLDYGAYFGANVGPVANRIGGAGFELDGETFNLDANENNETCLHGGAEGLGCQNWKFVSHDANSAHLRCKLPEDHMGFPGNFQADCIYTISDSGELKITLEGRCDKPTLCNLAHHSYFNLEDGGASDIFSHQMQISADTYLPINDKTLPKGPQENVEKTPFDFRISREIGQHNITYDHNYCLSPGRTNMRPVVEVISPSGKITLTIQTTEPGIQFYTGQWIPEMKPGLDAIQYSSQSGFCLETQGWPDAIHHADYPISVLRPGEVSSQETTYTFLLKS
ncbi:MAG: galactose mutarotase [Rhizobiaceae bacterium]|nr:galactose mutarotase [Rhizobiaceae bacterium]